MGSQGNVLGGTMIIAGTAIGAGMLALPMISAGMWIYWSLLLMVLTWMLMLRASQAILEAKPHFRIEASRCTECLGDYADPQCASICPIEGAIVNHMNEPLNPPGSLTGIPPDRRTAVMAEIAAR